MRRWGARLSAIIGAAAWVVGLPLIAIAGVIPSDAPYYVAGFMGAILGCAIVPFALTIPALGGCHRRNRILRIAGAAIGATLAAASVLLAMGAEGALGAASPDWIPTAATVPLVGLFVWVVAASAMARRELGNLAFWFAMLCGGSVAAAAVTSVLIPVATNATVPLTFAIAVAAWAGLPSWLVTVAWRERLT